MDFLRDPRPPQNGTTGNIFQFYATVLCIVWTLNIFQRTSRKGRIYITQTISVTGIITIKTAVVAYWWPVGTHKLIFRNNKRVYDQHGQLLFYNDIIF